MTVQESFKKRIRARMAQTGERYGAARRTLIERGRPDQADGGWVAQPEHSDEAIRRATGRGWDEWVTAIDAGPGRDAGHTAIAAWLHDARGVGSWWAQSVTVGYERITGLRLPGQMTDGTFTVSRSRTVDLDAAEFAAALWDDQARAAMLPGFASTARSRPGAKSPRFGLVGGEDGADLGVIQVTTEQAKGRAKIVITHEKLPTLAAADTWKQFWTDWLAALAGDAVAAER
ncbi:hypothetical protein [Microbacterium sp.]|uniref:hypothetical protein n=1 Tax=Microbacterium sp. TaxID=51671 RepID=UPI003A8A89BB